MWLRAATRCWVGSAKRFRWMPSGLRFGETVAADGATQVVCNHPDGNMFLPTAEDASEGYLYTNFECEPGGVSKIYIRNNGESWDVLEGESVDFCFGHGHLDQLRRQCHPVEHGHDGRRV